MRTLLHRPAVALTALLTGVLLLLAPAASAAGVPDAAATLKQGKVYVDPSMTGRFSEAQAADLTKKIADTDKPIFVAVVPANDQYPAATVARDLRTEVGVVGVYAIWRGEQFKAFSDRQALPPASADRIAGAAFRAHPNDVNGALNDFVDQAAPQTRGHGVASGGVSTAAIVVPLVLLALAGGGVLLLLRRAKRRKEEQRRAQLAQLRTVVDEDITAFGEELDRLDFDPRAADADDEQRTDYTRALDAYEQAKQRMDAATGPEDVRPVTEALEDGRFSLAVLAARRDKRPLPERRPPCFFDPRHGPSVEDADWAPAGGAPRSVPVCAQDAARLRSGLDPDVRTVPTEHGREPYWNAGPAYSPWAGGYFGSGMLPGLVAGTVLGSVLASPGSAWAADGYQGGPEGGEYSGADFDQNDFGGFDGGGGGDFGGGFDGGGGGDFGGGF
ncbi:hypothetical protein AB0442_33380 [Kitasatospora sp. NPDC085895]|uniref:hypothetical protein n=1 Tax=Kitasatospora sp. NPDC085895 TaxID=3155057 RepID=UPI00344F7E07